MLASNNDFHKGVILQNVHAKRNVRRKYSHALLEQKGKELTATSLEGWGQLHCAPKKAGWAADKPPMPEVGNARSSWWNSRFEEAPAIVKPGAVKEEKKIPGNKFIKHLQGPVWPLAGDRNHCYRSHGAKYLVKVTPPGTQCPKLETPSPTWDSSNCPGICWAESAHRARDLVCIVQEVPNGMGSYTACDKPSICGPGPPVMNIRTKIWTLSTWIIELGHLPLSHVSLSTGMEGCPSSVCTLFQQVLLISLLVDSSPLTALLSSRHGVIHMHD